MRQRLGITLASELEDATSSENKRDRSGSLDTASRLLSGLSLSNADRKSSSSGTGITSSSKPVLNSRVPVSSGRRSSDDGPSSVASPEDDGQVTQGDMLRQRRTHGHHLTPAEAKASLASSTTTSAAPQSKGVSTSSRPLAAPAATSTKPTTRSQISRFLGK